MNLIRQCDITEFYYIPRQEISRAESEKQIHPVIDPPGLPKGKYYTEGDLKILIEIRVFEHPYSNTARQARGEPIKRKRFSPREKQKGENRQPNKIGPEVINYTREGIDYQLFQDISERLSEIDFFSEELSWPDFKDLEKLIDKYRYFVDSLADNLRLYLNFLGSDNYYQLKDLLEKEDLRKLAHLVKALSSIVQQSLDFAGNEAEYFADLLIDNKIVY